MMDEHLKLDSLDWPEPDVMTTHPLLTFCRNPSDYFQMFSCEAGSCMTHEANSHFPVAREFMRRGIMCGNWFHYNPHTLGVFLEEDGEVMARAILLRDDVTKPFAQMYHDVHGVSQGAKHLLRDLLQDIGYTTYQGSDGLYRGQLTISEHFEIPGHELRGVQYSPMAFHDSVSTDYWVAYDAERKVFEYGPLETIPNNRRTISEHSTYTYNGFLAEYHLT